MSAITQRARTGACVWVMEWKHIQMTCGRDCRVLMVVALRRVLAVSIVRDGGINMPEPNK